MKTEIHLPWRALKAASLFASTDETRYVLTGIHIAMHKGHLVMVATDGKRLIVMRIQEFNELPADFMLTFAVPHVLLDLPDYEHVKLKCTIQEGDKRIHFYNHDAGFSVPIFDGMPYPKWQQVVPSNPNPQPQACLPYGAEMMRDLVDGVEMFTGHAGVIVWAPDTGSSGDFGPMYARPSQKGAHDCFAILMPHRLKDSSKDAAESGPLPQFLKEILGA